MLIFRLCTRTVLAPALCALTLCAVTAPFASAQPRPAPAPVPIAAPTPDQLADVREQLVTLLRMSPTLVQVVEADPSLLGDEDYVSRSNPQLAQFLTQHPEVARNPDFYLFANIGGREGRYVQPLHRAGAPRDIGNAELHREYVQNVSILLAFVGAVAALLWLIRLLLENRRWSRVFRQQTEIHSKLIDRFATNQELLEYMNTESGRRFLEASPIPIDPDRSQALPGGLARVMGPLQLGIVLTMLGLGLLIVEHSLHDYAGPFLLAGMVALMPGLGFIISAIVTWRLSAQLGLTPPPASENRQ
ncbi:MAG TPA: hypothetical protein VHU44_00765 [Acidobacteriaceae bacterium]|nr:hypothetical protein [Acidobacteriaceae bacterium]